MPNKIDPDERELEVAILKLEEAQKSLEMAKKNFLARQRRVDELFKKQADKNEKSKGKRWTSRSIMSGV